MPPWVRVAVANRQRGRAGGGAGREIAAAPGAGYHSDKAVSGLQALGFGPRVATGRPKHHAPLGPVQAGPLTAKAAAKEKVKAKLQTAAGRAAYGPGLFAV